MMTSTGNLAQFFAQSQQQSSSTSSGLARSGSSSYNLHSKAIDAEDDKHFEDTSFLLKRTRSVGLLDEFIAPTRKLIEEDQREKGILPNSDVDTSDEDDNQFIENVADEPELNESKPKNRNILQTYDDEDDEEYNNNDAYDNNRQTNEPRNDGTSPSLSPEGTPDIYQPHDDGDIEYEPLRHVDYLSHNWKESDISKSWRYIVLKRKDVANSARLENASWRTWAQAKYNLKTVSPESVNWLKDSDVTWLYGPLYREPDHGTGSTFDDLDKKYGSDTESSAVNAQTKLQKKKKQQQQQQEASKNEIKGPKPILKKRTVSEMLSQPSTIRLPQHHHNITHIPSPPIVEDDFDEISRKVNAQYSSGQKDRVSQTQQTLSLASTESPHPGSPKPRHIHFNDRVEQCIALNYPDTDNEYEAEDEDDDESEDDENNGADSDDSDDEGGFFLMVKSPSSAQLHGKDLQSLSSKDDSDDKIGSSSQTQDSVDSLKGPKLSKFQIIELLPATTLKYGSDEENFDNFAMSHNTNTSRGYDYHYDYNSVFKGNDHTIHIGSNDFEYEETPQHLEGVNMVDVPENIVLGSNIEIVDAPQFIETAPSSHFESPPISHQSLRTESVPQKPPSSAQQQQNSHRQPVKKGFAFHSDSEEDSENEEEGRGGIPIGSGGYRATSPNSPGSSVKNYGGDLARVSSSPSCASLSDVAAQGFISQSSSGNNNLSTVISGISSKEDLSKDLGNLNVGDGDNKDKGFASNFLKSWKKQ